MNNQSNSSHSQTRPNKTEAGSGSNGICRVIDASCSPSPDPSRSPNEWSQFNE